MKPPLSVAAKIRILAERLGYYIHYPSRNDPLTLTQVEIERYALEVFESSHIDWRVWEGFSESLARGLARHIARQFVQRVPYGVPVEEPRANPNAITGNERARALRSFAGTIRHKGMDADEMAGMLLVLNDSRCTPPLPAREVASIARSMANKPAARPLATELVAA